MIAPWLSVSVHPLHWSCVLRPWTRGGSGEEEVVTAVVGACRRTSPRAVMTGTRACPEALTVFLCWRAPAGSLSWGGGGAPQRAWAIVRARSVMDSCEAGLAAGMSAA